MHMTYRNNNNQQQYKDERQSGTKSLKMKRYKNTMQLRLNTFSQIKPYLCDTFYYVVIICGDCSASYTIHIHKNAVENGFVDE